MAVGGVPILVRANLLAAVVNMTLIYPALLAFGIEGVAAIVTVSYACQYLVFLPVLKDRLALSPREFMTPLSKPLIAGTITLAAMVAFQGADALGHGQLRFWLAGLSSVAIYIAVFGLLSRGTAYRDLYNLIRSRSTSA